MILETVYHSTSVSVHSPVDDVHLEEQSVRVFDTLLWVVVTAVMVVYHEEQTIIDDHTRFDQRHWRYQRP